MIAFDLSWFSSIEALGFWEWMDGMGIMFFAVAYFGRYWVECRHFKGEPREDSNVLVPFESLKRQWDTRVREWREKWIIYFWRLLLIGLLIELLAFSFTVTISAKQIESLENANLGLRRQLLDLQTKEQVRIFTRRERNDFIAYLQDKPKGPVRMGVLGGFSEKTRIYAGEIQDLLNASGYQVNGIEVLNPAHFIPSLPPDTSIGVYVWSPEDKPPYAAAISAALAEVADKVSVGTLYGRTNWQVPNFQTNQVMVFIANHR